jgi:lactoylglutathione lyase
MTDLGVTHLALAVKDLDQSLAFYEDWADLHPVHRRQGVAWITDGLRPFAIVLAEVGPVVPLQRFSHLGIAVSSHERVVALAARAEREGILLEGPVESGPPVGTWCFIADPDGHTVEFSFGQQVERSSRSVERTSTGRLPAVSVIGSGVDRHDSLALPLGKLLAEMNVDLICGGGGGVMDSVAQGFVSVPQRIGRATGILPEGPPSGYPGPHIEFVINTHLGDRGPNGGTSRSRNHIVVLSGDVVVALPGGPGTASEIALAERYHRPLIEIGTRGDLEGLRSRLGVLLEH